jgi:hypothetical protein
MSMVQSEHERIVYRPVCCFVVDMHERALYVGQNFKFVLQLLADIVRLPEWRISIHDHVNFDEVVLKSPLVVKRLNLNFTLTGPLCKDLSHCGERNKEETNMVRSHSIKLLDFIAEGGGLINDEL